MFNLIFFSVRATSEDEAMVTSWVEVTVSGLDSRKSVRADFTLGVDNNNSDSDFCRGHHDDDNEVTAVPVRGQIGSGSSGTLNFSTIVIFSLLILSLACT